MLSRILWIGLTAIALAAGIAWQGGYGIVSWGDDSDRPRIEARIDEAIGRGFDKMQVTDENGETIDVPRETKQAFANAVSRLVESETELAMLRIRKGSVEKIGAAEARRDAARADLDKLKEQIERQKALAEGSSNQPGDQIRADVRERVRGAVKN